MPPSGLRTSGVGRRTGPGLHHGLKVHRTRFKEIAPSCAVVLGYNQNWGLTVRNEFSAIIEKDEEWFIAYCPEVPGANGQGRTVNECRRNLADAISLILEDRRADAFRGLPPDALRETVVVQ